MYRCVRAPSTTVAPGANGTLALIAEASRGAWPPGAPMAHRSDSEVRECLGGEALGGGARRGDAQHAPAGERDVEHRLAVDATKGRAAGDRRRATPVELRLDLAELRRLHGKRDEPLAGARPIHARGALRGLDRLLHLVADDARRLAGRDEVARAEALAGMAGLVGEQLLVVGTGRRAAGLRGVCCVGARLRDGARVRAAARLRASAG